MNEQSEDTEILLALLSSMLESPFLSHDALLGALADAGGNVEEAARVLNGGRRADGSKPRPKRKRNNGLDGWVTNKKRPAATSPGRTPARGAPSSKGRLEPLAPGYTAEEPIFLESGSEDERGFEGDTSWATGDLIMSPPATDKSTKSLERGDMYPEKSLMTVLKQAPAAAKAPPKLLPRTLGTPALVAQYTPCTMHASVLPPELACRLFYAMLGEATSWSRNKWWLFDRLVESPHKTSFYARSLPQEGDEDMKEAARYWYNGRPSPSPGAFLPEMEEACEIIERVVNEEIRNRGKLFPSEWPASAENPWRANVGAANCYTGSKETVGYHSDQLTYLGPCPTIASLSLGTTRTFRLREVVPQSEKEERNAQTYNIPVTHNSLLIMHASCQERFKHTIPPQQTIDAFKPPFPPPPLPPAVSVSSPDRQERSDGRVPQMMPPDTSRINITFRFYRPDFAAKTIPKCQCGIPTILRPDMKRRDSSAASEWEQTAKMRYFWMCYAGAQNDGKGCSFFQILDMEKEGRGVKVGSVSLDKA